MEQVILDNKKEVTYLSDLTINDHIGFLDLGDKKGYFVYVGDTVNGEYVLSAVSTNEGWDLCNISYGFYENNKFTSIPKKLGNGSYIKEMYKFNSRKDLYKWLSK